MSTDPDKTPLEERMKLHKHGQITWPEPQLKRWCSDCDHFTQAGIAEVTKANGRGRCGLVRAHHHSDGNLFVGTEGIACPQFRERETEK